VRGIAGTGRYGADVPESDDELRALLGADPPDSVLALDPATRTALAEILRDARARQTRALEESFTATLKHVPFPVRGVVKKVLLG
jgi:hypothetical protein